MVRVVFGLLTVDIKIPDDLHQPILYTNNNNAHVTYTHTHTRAMHVRVCIIKDLDISELCFVQRLGHKRVMFCWDVFYFWLFGPPLVWKGWKWLAQTRAQMAAKETRLVRSPRLMNTSNNKSNEDTQPHTHTHSHIHTETNNCGFSHCWEVFLFVHVCFWIQRA